MAHSYDTTQYLLDRANLHDTATRMYMFTDLKRWDGLVNDVLGNKVMLDYTAMFGGTPSDVTGEDMVKQWEGMMNRLDSTQHLITSLLIELPQPDETGSLPMTAKVIANVSVTLVRKAAKGDPIVRNGGRGFFDMVRTEAKGNPWRINGFKVDPAWFSGNWDVYS